MIEILKAVLALGALGFIVGAFLGAASVFLYVPQDPTVEKINAVLPQANCGLCGYPGCLQYAKAVAQGKAPPNKCVPGGPAVAKKIQEILKERAQQQKATTQS